MNINEVWEDIHDSACHSFPFLIFTQNFNIKALFLPENYWCQNPIFAHFKNFKHEIERPGMVFYHYPNPYLALPVIIYLGGKQPREKTE